MDASELENEIADIESQVEQYECAKQDAEKRSTSISAAMKQLETDVELFEKLEKNAESAREELEQAEARRKEASETVVQMHCQLEDEMSLIEHDRSVLEELSSIGEDVTEPLQMLEDREDRVKETNDHLQSLASRLGISIDEVLHGSTPESKAADQAKGNKSTELPERAEEAHAQKGQESVEGDEGKRRLKQNMPVSDWDVVDAEDGLNRDASKKPKQDEGKRGRIARFLGKRGFVLEDGVFKRDNSQFHHELRLSKDGNRRVEVFVREKTEELKLEGSWSVLSSNGTVGAAVKGGSAEVFGLDIGPNGSADYGESTLVGLSYESKKSRKRVEKENKTYFGDRKEGAAFTRTREWAVGKRCLSGKIGASLFDENLSFKPQVSLSGEYERSGLSDERKYQIGYDDTNITGSAKGVLGSVEAKADVKLGFREGIDAGASFSAGAYAVSGQAVGSFSLFGIKLDVTGKANVGVGAEAKAEFSAAKGFGFSVGGTLGLGGGVSVEVDWSGVTEVISKARGSVKRGNVKLVRGREAQASGPKRGRLHGGPRGRR